MLVFFPLTLLTVFFFLSFVSDWLCRGCSHCFASEGRGVQRPCVFISCLCLRPRVGVVGYKKGRYLFQLFLWSHFSFLLPFICYNLTPTPPPLFPLSLPVCPPQLFSLVHPPHTGFLLALTVCVCAHMCVKFTGFACTVALDSAPRCEAHCVSVIGVLWGAALHCTGSRNGARRSSEGKEKGRMQFERVKNI